MHTLYSARKVLLRLGHSVREGHSWGVGSYGHGRQRRPDAPPGGWNFGSVLAAVSSRAQCRGARPQGTSAHCGRWEPLPRRASAPGPHPMSTGSGAPASAASAHVTRFLQGGSAGLVRGYSERVQGCHLHRGRAFSAHSARCSAFLHALCASGGSRYCMSWPLKLAICTRSFSRSFLFSVGAAESMI